MVGDMVEQRLHQGRLPAASSAADDTVLSLPDQPHHGISNLFRQAARSNKFVGRIPAVEFSDGHGDAVDRCWRSYDGNTRAIGEPGVENRVLIGEVLAELPGNLLGRS